jgi:hypothetical protein
MAALRAQQPGIVREGNQFRRDFYGSHPAARKLRINAHGPVTLLAGTTSTVSYSVSVTVRARSETEARRVLERYAIRVETVGDRVVLTAPGGPVISTVTVKTPRLDAAAISTSTARYRPATSTACWKWTRARGELTIDRIKGDCKLVHRRRRCEGRRNRRRIVLPQRRGPGPGRHRTGSGNSRKPWAAISMPRKWAEWYAPKPAAAPFTL